MKRINKKLEQLLKGRYGLDDLGKVLVVASFIVCILGTILGNELIIYLAILGFIFAIYRIMSQQHWERSNENRIYIGYIKLWKLRFDNRKHSCIFMCKRCGKYIRVPRGKGKIQITCTSCGDKTIHRT